MPDTLDGVVVGPEAMMTARKNGFFRTDVQTARRANDKNVRGGASQEISGKEVAGGEIYQDTLYYRPHSRP